MHPTLYRNRHLSERPLCSDLFFLSFFLSLFVFTLSSPFTHQARLYPAFTPLRPLSNKLVLFSFFPPKLGPLSPPRKSATDKPIETLLRTGINSKTPKRHHDFRRRYVPRCRTFILMLISILRPSLLQIEKRTALMLTNRSLRRRCRFRNPQDGDRCREKSRRRCGK